MLYSIGYAHFLWLNCKLGVSDRLVIKLAIDWVYISSLINSINWMLLTWASTWIDVLFFNEPGDCSGKSNWAMQEVGLILISHKDSRWVSTNFHKSTSRPLWSAVRYHVQCIPLWEFMVWKVVALHLRRGEYFDHTPWPLQYRYHWYAASVRFRRHVLIFTRKIVNDLDFIPLAHFAQSSACDPQRSICRNCLPFVVHRFRWTKCESSDCVSAIVSAMMGRWQSGAMSVRRSSLGTCSVDWRL